MNPAGQSLLSWILLCQLNRKGKQLFLYEQGDGVGVGGGGEGELGTRCPRSGSLPCARTGAQTFRHKREGERGKKADAGRGGRTGDGGASGGKP